MLSAITDNNNFIFTVPVKIDTDRFTGVIYNSDLEMAHHFNLGAAIFERSSAP